MVTLGFATYTKVEEEQKMSGFGARLVYLSSLAQNS